MILSDFISGRIFKKDMHDKQIRKYSVFDQIIRCEGGITLLRYDDLRRSRNRMTNYPLLKLKQPYKSAIGRDVFVICRSSLALKTTQLVKQLVDPTDPKSREITLASALRNDSKLVDSHRTDFWWDIENDFFICLSKMNATAIIFALVSSIDNQDKTEEELAAERIGRFNLQQRTKRKLKREITNAQNINDLENQRALDYLDLW